MSTLTAPAKGGRRHRDKERYVATAQRRESLQLDRTLRCLGLQHRRQLAGVQGAQLELRRALDRLGGCRTAVPPLPHLSADPPAPHVRNPSLQSCCPNHIVCSTCNLRLRLADALLRRFTPGLWTMYSHPPHLPHLPHPPALALTSTRGHTSLCRMPSFMERRNLSAFENSLRYLPFM